MTTGPFNINGTLPLNGTIKISGRYGNGEPMPSESYSDNGHVFKQRIYIRDKSINNPPTKNHWREPTSWNSRTMNAVIRPAGIAQSVQTLSGVPLYRKQFDVLDGYGAAAIDTNFPAFDAQKWIDVTVTKALLKLKNQRVNVSNAFGERREVVRMFEHLSKATITGLLGFKQSLKGRKLVYTGRGALYKPSLRKMKDFLVKDLPADLHDHWLEYIYGLNPLMQDLYGSMESLAYRESDGNAYRVTVVSSHKEVDNEKRRKISWAGFGNGADAGFWQTRRIVSTVHTSLTYVMENPFTRSLAQLGVTNPAVTAWELTRLSFVVDWALPIGDYLSTWDADFGFRFKGGTSSVLRKGRSTFVPYQTDSVSPNTAIRVTYFLAEKPSWEASTFTRQKYVTSPLPRVPRFKNPLSGIHVANALALLRGAFL